MKYKNKKNSREIDKLTEKIVSSQKEKFVFIRRSKIRIWQALAIIAFLVGSVTTILWMVYHKMQQESHAAFVRSPLMSVMKTRGCVADGLLTGSGGDTNELINMINRSQCQYLHRAIETWVTPPDFNKISENMAKITKPGIIYGMFLAEALNPNADYHDDNNRKFDFSKMCEGGSQGFWGDNTCKASFDSQEYRDYLKYITHKAINLGVKSFLFGQIYFQDNSAPLRSRAKEIVEDMRSYATSQGQAITIGAQTDNITDPDYLQFFDYIEGGVGVHPNGDIENGPCYSKWWKKPGDRCWALLWHPEFSTQANDVLINFDWSGFSWDDMSTFAQMDKSTRIKTLNNLYTYFTSKNMGFLMPFLAVINEDINGCSGPEKNYYAPDNKYSCQDENEMNAILGKGKLPNNSNVSNTSNTSPDNSLNITTNPPPIPSAILANNKNDAQFISQVVPTEMVAGYRYQISIIMKNTGDWVWNKSGLYYLEPKTSTSQFSLSKVEFGDGDSVAPGQTKEFIFYIVAPQEPGQYTIEWQMGRESSGNFGNPTESLNVTVTAGR